MRPTGPEMWGTCLAFMLLSAW